MIYIDDNYNVWLVTLIGASRKPAQAPLLLTNKENKKMIDLAKIIEDAVADRVAERIQTSVQNYIEYMDLDDKIDDSVGEYIDGCDDLIQDAIDSEVRRHFE